MRLLRIDDRGVIRLTRDLSSEIPPYAILSHTWAVDDTEEVTFAEVATVAGQQKKGYQKIQFCVEQAKKDGIGHCWVDTCCIDKANNAELSEAITSMFRWYQNAVQCYVYLPDVTVRKRKRNDEAGWVWESSFRQSRWFTRGWTLQELLAPQEVVFFSQEGTRLGTKHELIGLLHEITGIPTAAFGGQRLSTFSIEERMRWTRGRTTKKKEDEAYCLLGIFGVYMPLIYGEGDHAFVRLSEEVNKTPKATFSLRVAEGAEFDSYGQTHQGCHRETRVNLLQSVRDWSRDECGRTIFWLSGMAGSGKSTISWTVANWLAGLGSGGPVSLGASFFFKRGEGDRASAAALFPTIAIQLAARVSHFDVFLAQAVRLHPQIGQKSLGEQFDKLICQPLRQLPTDEGQSTYVVVLDALDECDNEADIRTVLQLWSTIPITQGVRLRLFLTSRPELVIRLGFRKMPTTQHQDVVLHEVPQPVIEHDIRAYLTHALIEVRDNYNLEPAGDTLADDWPNPSMVLQLTSIAVPLFIVAATIYRFIRDAERPQGGLDMILQSGLNTQAADLGGVYKTVLLKMTASVKDQSSEERVWYEFRLIVGTIVCLAEPLSRKALATLLDVSTGDIQLRLRSLHALLQVPNAEDALIRPLHLSLSEYLTSSSSWHEAFAIEATSTHCTIWQQCLRLLSGPDGLRENMCELSHPGCLRSEIDPSHVAYHLPLAIQYACRYWVYHVQSSASTLSDGDEVYRFLQLHFLHWLEALSLLERVADAIGLINDLLSQVGVSQFSFRFLCDDQYLPLFVAVRGLRSDYHFLRRCPTLLARQPLCGRTCTAATILQRPPVCPSAQRRPALLRAGGGLGTAESDHVADVEP